jgi:Ca2+-binding EF-hand superfamily protein
MLRATNKNIFEIFKTFDTDGSGELSNLEFKNALRSLNIALTAKEIDLILNYCDNSGDGVVNYREFVEKFQLG